MKLKMPERKKLTMVKAQAYLKAGKNKVRLPGRDSL